MPEKTCTSSPSSSRRCSSGEGRAARLFCAPELPGVSLCLADENAGVRPRHAHDSLTLGVVTAGTRRMETPQGVAEVATHELFVLPPGLAHACAPVGRRCSHLVLSVAAQRLPPGFPHALPLHLRDAQLAGLLLALAETLEASAGGLERQSLLAEILERLAAHAVTESARERAAGPTGELAEAVRLARRLLEEESGADLNSLAEACGVGPYALHRAFTRAVGLPPHAFQTHVRLRRAKELLRAGTDLGEAALDAGFCDQSHMNRHFARIVGLTPAQYARAHVRRS